MLRRPNAFSRAGSTSIGALIALVVLLLIAGGVLYIISLRDAKTETQNGADAAALAAARKLACDDLLTTNQERAERRLAQARDAAVQLGFVNIAAGQRLELDRNAENHPDGDIVFGSLDHPLGGTFVPMNPKADPSEWVGARVNAVRVTTHRGPIRSPLGVSDSKRDILSRSVAMLDWSVVGFRPKDDAPLPLIPIGIFTDHKGEFPHSCETHLRRDADDWSFDYMTKKCSPGRDGIREVDIVLGRRAKGSHAVPAMFLQLGADDFAGMMEQVNSGVTRQHLDRKFGSGFVLNHDNVLEVFGSARCPQRGHESREALERALRHLAESGEPRIWPLFSNGDEDTETVHITGWLGARVVSVTESETDGLKVRLQLAVVCHPATVTERRETPPGFWATNRTVCRVRLAE